MTKKITTRFAPSPTGPFHIGNARTALFNYLYAKQNSGDFIVRIEDTDRLRSRKEHEEEMLKSLEWLGLNPDGKPWRQSERSAVYKAYLEKLIKQDKAYLSIETSGENREVVRFRNPGIVVRFRDLVRGEIVSDTRELGDFVIAKNLEEPIFHLAVVIDDFEAGITHVLRGEDHLSNTARQILLGEAIGAPRPVYVHLPLILAPDRSKLSKRKHGEAVSLNYYRNKGYLSEAILNYLALLGWNPGTEEEIFNLKDLLERFDIKDIHKNGAIFDERKLEWVNKEHVKLLPEGERQKFLARDFDLGKTPELDKEKVVWKSTDIGETVTHLLKAKEIISGVGDGEVLKQGLMAYAESQGRGKVLWPLRYALSGQEVSPDPFTLIALLGQVESISRIERAVEILQK